MKRGEMAQVFDLRSLFYFTPITLVKKTIHLSLYLTVSDSEEDLKIKLRAITLMKAEKSVSTATAGQLGFDSRQWQDICFSTASRSVLGPIQPPIQLKPGRGLFLRGQSNQGVKLTIQLYLVPRSKMVSLELHSPYDFMEWGLIN
jgi:hypothetical protein